MSTQATTLVMLDVRDLAHGLGLQPIELVNELLSDDVPLLPLSPKRWRVSEPDYNAWVQRRQQKAAEAAQQRRLRSLHVASKSEPTGKRRAQFRR
jgi:hypothetical protein